MKQVAREELFKINTSETGKLLLNMASHTQHKPHCLSSGCAWDRGTNTGMLGGSSTLRSHVLLADIL